MTRIFLKDVTVNYPVYNIRTMSLRNRLIMSATGGRIVSDAKQITKITALKNVNFELKDGDAVGLIGHNGAGKSTLLRTIAGIYLPSQGEIVVEGKIATVFEVGAGMDLELSGYDNILRLGMMLGLSYKQCKKITPEIATFTELGSFLELPIRTYSSGMVMRLMFAIATSITPEILLIDEMFSTGDASFQDKSEKRIKELITNSKIFVFASHDVNSIKKYCNRIFKLEHGTVSEVNINSLSKLI